MSMSPADLLARLDELKKWQEEQQERLLKQHISRIEEVENSKFCTPATVIKKYELENILIEPEEISVQNSVDKSDIKCDSDPSMKPKQPFLKRGTGLKKFGMKYGDQKQPFHKMKPPKIYKTEYHKKMDKEKRSCLNKEPNHSINTTKSNQQNNINNHATTSSITIQSVPINNTKSFSSNVTKSSTSIQEVIGSNENSTKQVKITPLKAPESMLHKAKWCPITTLDDFEFATPLPADDNNLYEERITPLPSQEIQLHQYDESIQTPGNTLQALQENPELLQCLQKLAAEHFGETHSFDQTNDILNKLSLDDESVSQTPIKNNTDLVKYLQNLVNKYENKTSDHDLSAYEAALAKELRLFEQLEEKTSHSSFCSTNSSVLELLASTPSKVMKMPTIETIQERSEIQQLPRFFPDKENYHNTSENRSKKTLNYSTGIDNCSDVETPVTFSDESSVDSDDFDATDVNIVVKQNACTMTDNDHMVDDEVLSKKLKELEGEISNFRTENRKIEIIKHDLERERMDLQRAKKKLEKDYLAKQEELEIQMENERKKIQKDKVQFERMTKEAQNKPNRREREEISCLKAELETVREALKLKETRNGTTQARLRNQIKAFEKDVSRLKEENEQLTKKLARLQVQQTTGTKKTNADTKMLHEINKTLTKLSKDQTLNKKDLKKRMEDSFEENANDDSFIHLQKSNSKTNIKRSTSRPRNKSPSSSEEESDDSIKRPSSSRSNRSSRKSSSRRSRNKSGTRDQDSESSDEERRQSSKQQKQQLRSRNRETEYTSAYGNYRSNNNPNNEIEEISTRLRRTRSPTRLSTESNSGSIPNKENNRNLSNGDITAFHNLGELSLLENYEKVFGNSQNSNTNPQQNRISNKLIRHNSLNDTQQTISKIETILADGCKETKYPNGNTKLISSDGNYIKMKYFNGDIKETHHLEGSVKYYYKDTQVWQTTFANGDETFEFPDGQKETHFSNGASHIKFPNGIIKEVSEKGVEKIQYPDGSVVTVSQNGDKVLLLPNGQKEIHTEAHKRREYPDGTVKIIYPDGLQETRYSNGRIRMKDKDGNLIMDSHED